MAADYRSHSAVGVGSGDLTITKPTGTVDGDFLIAGFAHATTGGTLNVTATGWTQRGTIATTQGHLCVMTKVASGEGASWAFTPSVSNDCHGIVVAISGGSGSYEMGTMATAANAVTATLTTTLAGCLVCIAGGEANSAQTYASDGSYVERADIHDATNSDVHIAAYTLSGTTAGAQTITVTATGGTHSPGAVLFLVQDAAAAATSLALPSPYRNLQHLLIR